MFSRAVRGLALTGTGLALVACASTSRFEGLTTDELYRMAQDEYQAGDYHHAAETLERVLTEASFEQAAAAQLLLAEAYFADEQFIIATTDFTTFLNRYPAHPDAAKAALGVCRSWAAQSPITQRDQQATETALLVCPNVARDYAGTPEAEQAAAITTEMRDKLAKKLYETASSYLRKNFVDSSIIYFQMVLDRFPASPYAPRALLRMIEAYTKVGYDDEVEETRAKLLGDYPDSPEARSIGGAEPAPRETGA